MAFALAFFPTRPARTHTPDMISQRPSAAHRDAPSWAGGIDWWAGFAYHCAVSREDHRRMDKEGRVDASRSSAPLATLAHALGVPFPQGLLFAVMGGLALLFIILLFAGPRRRPEHALFGEEDEPAPRATRGYVLALLDAERPHDAMPVARAHLRALPADIHMRALLGALIASQGDHAAACAEFERAVAQSQRQSGALAPTLAGFLASTCAVYALSLRTLGRMPDALRMEQEAQRLDPAAARVQVGGVELLSEYVRSDELERQAYEDLARWEQDRALAAPFGIPEITGAIQFYSSAVAARPHNARLRADLGQALHASGDHFGAEREFREALRLDPLDAWVWYAYALMHWRLRHPVEAQQALDEALRVAPAQAGILSTRAIFALRQGRYLEAERDAALAAQARPDVSSIAWLRGIVAQRQGHLETAARAFDDAERLGATDLSFRLAYAATKEALRDQPGANEQYRLAMRLAPTHGPARVEYAAYLFRQGRLQEAEVVAHEALRLEGGHEAHTWLVRVLLLERRLEEVVNHLRPAMQLAPGSLDLRVLQAEWLLLRGQPAQAEEMLRSGQTAETATDDNAQAQVVRGEALHMLGRDLESTAALREAVRLDPDLPNRVLAQARALREDERIAPALEALERVVQLQPEWAEAAEVRAEYDTLVEMQRAKRATRRLTFGPRRTSGPRRA